MEAHEFLPQPKPVRTFVMFDGKPCLIAEIFELEYKLVTISDSPQYIYVHQAALKDLPANKMPAKPKAYPVSRICDIMDTVFILWHIERDGKMVEVIEFGYYMSVNYAGTKITLINDKKQGYVKATPTKLIRQVFYFDTIYT